MLNYLKYESTRTPHQPRRQEGIRRRTENMATKEYRWISLMYNSQTKKSYYILGKQKTEPIYEFDYLTKDYTIVGERQLLKAFRLPNPLSQEKIEQFMNANKDFYKHQEEKEISKLTSLRVATPTTKQTNRQVKDV